MNTLKNILKVAAISLPLILGGYRDFSKDFYKFKVKENLVIRATRDNQGNNVKIYELKDADSSLFLQPTLFAVDNKPYFEDSIGDGRFDEIELRNVPKGHLLEKYVPLDSLDKLYKEVKETGVLKKQVEVSYSYLLTVTNPFDKPIQVVVYERIPQPQKLEQGRELTLPLNVDYENVSSLPHKVFGNGLVRWDLRIASKERKEIDFNIHLVKGS